MAKRMRRKGASYPTEPPVPARRRLPRDQGARRVRRVQGQRAQFADPRGARLRGAAPCRSQMLAILRLGRRRRFPSHAAVVLSEGSIAAAWRLGGRAVIGRMRALKPMTQGGATVSTVELNARLVRQIVMAAAQHLFCLRCCADRRARSFVLLCAAWRRGAARPGTTDAGRVRAPSTPARGHWPSWRLALRVICSCCSSLPARPGSSHAPTANGARCSMWRSSAPAWLGWRRRSP
jgi:hypothetical protein